MDLRRQGVAGSGWVRSRPNADSHDERFGDQMFWGIRAFASGVGPRPVRRGGLAAERLATAMDSVRGDRRYREAAGILRGSSRPRTVQLTPWPTSRDSPAPVEAQLAPHAPKHKENRPRTRPAALEAFRVFGGRHAAPIEPSHFNLTDGTAARGVERGTESRVHFVLE